MPYLVRGDQSSEDEHLSELRSGSVWMVTGFIFFGFAAMLGIYDFIDTRQGSHTMLVTTGILGLIGLVLIGLGELRRNQNTV